MAKLSNEIATEYLDKTFDSIVEGAERNRGEKLTVREESELFTAFQGGGMAILALIFKSKDLDPMDFMKSMAKKNDN